MRRKIIVFSAHPDDETLGAGGTILKHIDSGDEVFWVVFTLKLSDSSREYTTYREKLVEKVSKEYGFADTFILDFPSGELDKVGFRELIDKTIEVVKRVKPDVIYTVGRSDVHTDHDLVYRAVMVASKPSIHRISEIYAYEIPSSTNWAFSEKGIGSHRMFMWI